jgi:GMP synthase-like glutamine amidotransferase
MILYIKHIALEGPETLGTFLAQQGFSSKTIEVWRGDPLPEDLSGIQAVVCLGGPMNVYEEEQYPFLKREDSLIRKVLEEDVPFLGICLGSQLLAKANGARVSRAREEEIGFSQVRLTEEGMRDPLLKGVPPDMEVFQWHGDTFDIPAQAAWLARGAVCPHQAFRVGRCAYGVQFHVEITGKNIQEWAEAYLDLSTAAHRLKKDALLTRYAQRKEKFHQTAEQIYNNFSKIITGHRR